MCASAEAEFSSSIAYNLLSAIFRGLGDSRSPLLFVLVACLVNIAGDLILVAGFGMDAAGAAIATVLAQAVQCGVRSCCCSSKRSCPLLHARRLSPESPVQKVFEHRSAARLAGVFDAAVVPRALRVRQPAGPDSVVGLRRCEQDRQLCHADPERADAVNGVVRRAERGRGKSEARKAVDADGHRRGAVFWLRRIRAL